MNFVSNAIKFTDEGRIKIISEWDPDIESIESEDLVKEPKIISAYKKMNHLIHNCTEEMKVIKSESSSELDLP